MYGCMYVCISISVFIQNFEDKYLIQKFTKPSLNSLPYLFIAFVFVCFPLSLQFLLC